MYASLMLFMGIAAMNSQANLLFGVFGLMVGVLLVCGVISRLMLVGLTVRRVLPDAAVVGAAVAVGYEFENRKRFWPSLSIAVAELDGVEAFRKQPFAYLLHAAAKTSALVNVEITPKRRGVYQLGDYQVSTSFPFGFVKRAATRHQDDSLLVFPALARVDERVLRLLRSAETAGVTVRPRRGGEDELYGIKEYRTGENARMIHWKRSARTGQLVIREMTQVSPPRVMLVVDTRLPDRSVRSHEAVERAIAVAASLASELIEKGLMVGVAAATPGSAEAEYTMVMPNRGKRHRRDVLTALARLPLNTNVEARGVLEQVMRSVKAGTTPVLVTPHEVEQGLAEQARGSVVVLSSLSPQVRAWFTFPEGADFAVSMPIDQQPDLEPAGPQAKAGR